MAFKPYKPSPHSKAADKAEEMAFMRRNSTPTVKAVRDESRKDKSATVAAKAKATTSPKYRGGPEGDGKSVEASRKRTPAPFSKGKGSPSSSIMKRAEASTSSIERKTKRTPRSTGIVYGGGRPVVLEKYNEQTAENFNRAYKDPEIGARMNKLISEYKPRPLRKINKTF